MCIVSNKKIIKTSGYLFNSKMQPYIGVTSAKKYSSTLTFKLAVKSGGPRKLRQAEIWIVTFCPGTFKRAWQPLLQLKACCGPDLMLTRCLGLFNNGMAWNGIDFLCSDWFLNKIFIFMSWCPFTFKSLPNSFQGYEGQGNLLQYLNLNWFDDRDGYWKWNRAKVHLSKQIILVSIPA